MDTNVKNVVDEELEMDEEMDMDMEEQIDDVPEIPEKPEPQKNETEKPKEGRVKRFFGKVRYKVGRFNRRHPVIANTLSYGAGAATVFGLGALVNHLRKSDEEPEEIETSFADPMLEAAPEEPVEDFVPEVEVAEPTIETTEV